MKYLKKINEEVSTRIVNKSDIDKDPNGNLSAENIINTQDGKKPYRKVYRRMVAIEPGKSIPSNGIYWLNERQRDMINNLGESIEKAIDNYDQLLEALKVHWGTPDWEEVRDAKRAEEKKQSESLERDNDEKSEDI